MPTKTDYSIQELNIDNEKNANTSAHTVTGK